MLLLRRLLVIYLVVMLSAGARAEEARRNGAVAGPLIDSEHIFGFAEGSDIGEKGELEIESTTIGSFGAPAGSMPTPITKPRFVMASPMSCGSQLARSPIISTFTMCLASAIAAGSSLAAS
jgi:hypothetical protein